MPKVILASSSVQRKALLEELGIPFDIIVSNVDETPVNNLTVTEQMNDIAMRKALAVMDMVNETADTEDYIVVAADQNIFFNGKMYGKPSSIDEAREIIKTMQGSDEIYAYVGNAVLYVSNSVVVKHLSECDTARMRMDYISDEVLESYLATGSPLNKCAGINVLDTPGLHLEAGNMSTARGMTVDYLKDMLSQF